MKNTTVLWVLLLVVLFGRASFIKGMYTSQTSEVSTMPAGGVTVPSAPENINNKTNVLLKALTDKVGGKIATLDQEGRLQLWDSSTGNLLKTLEQRFHPQRTLGLAFGPKGTNLMLIDNLGSTMHVEVLTLEELKQIEAHKKAKSESLFPAPNGNFSSK